MPNRTSTPCRTSRTFIGVLLSALLYALLPCPLPAVELQHEEIRPTDKAIQDLREEARKFAAKMEQNLSTRLDQWHDWLYLRTQEYITRFDQHYASPDTEPLPVPASPFRIGLESDFVHRQDGLAVTPRLDVDVLLHLPNIEHRLRIFITSDTVDESPNDLNRASSAVSAGLRFSPLHFIDLDLGIRADVPPNAFVSARWQRRYDLAGWEVQPFTKLYLETKDGLGAAAGLTLNHWMDRWLFRSATYANWLKDHDDTTWTQTLILAHVREVIASNRFTDVAGARDLARGWGLQVQSTGTRNLGTQTYEASLFFKQPTRNRWLYWHVAPLVSWERQYGWHPDPGIRVGFDALFWGLSTQ